MHKLELTMIFPVLKLSAVILPIFSVIFLYRPTYDKQLISH